MDRKIIFRGKSIYNGEWVEGYYARLPFGREHWILDGTIFLNTGRPCKEPVDPSTVGQYTGLTDKNGRKIFEGDIVTGYFNYEKIGGYILYGSEAEFFIERDGLYGIGLNNASDWVKVIGNIHDNPELIGGVPNA